MSKTPDTSVDIVTSGRGTGKQSLSHQLSVKGLQSSEHGRILDVIHQVRKQGLEGDLSLPQIVVCGDQSSGKSSLLAALTGLQLPRSDNMCTRYATEINLKPGIEFSVSLKIIPDPDRPQSQQTSIKTFYRQVTDLKELPKVMDDAMTTMGITPSTSTVLQLGDAFRAISKDVLSLDIEGPDRPQLTLVDIPGLIATDTKSASTSDVEAIGEITEKYIIQSRTIVLAVVSAAHDYANQRILRRVREVDSAGTRSMGIITKPDRVEGNGSKQAFLELAQNEDIKFKLGWHVVMNRNDDEQNLDIEQQKLAEMKWFKKEFMKSLPANIVGVDALRTRLSSLLFEHVKRELPALKKELEDTLETSEDALELLGTRRSTANECKSYLENLCMNIYSVCKAAIEGHYEGSHFRGPESSSFRARAIIQRLNSTFAEHMRKNGHKFYIDFKNENDLTEGRVNEILKFKKKGKSMVLSKKEGIEWARHFMGETRGKELPGNYNPLLIGELFFDQSASWPTYAKEHVQKVHEACAFFLVRLLRKNCPEDVAGRIWDYMEEELTKRKTAADEELAKLIVDADNYPINYNHYYTETISSRRKERNRDALTKEIQQSIKTTQILNQAGQYQKTQTIDVGKAVTSHMKNAEADMEDFACLEALDCVIAIYKVSLKVFTANVTTQVIERHIVRGLDEIFSPHFLGHLTEADCQKLIAEPLEVQRERFRLEDKIAKLKEGYDAFRLVMGVKMR